MQQTFLESGESMSEPKQGPVRVGAIADIPVGSFRFVQIGDREVGLTQLPSGEIRAVRNFCPHRGAPVCRGLLGGTWPPCEPGKLEFARAGEILICPWHGFEYDLMTGRELFQEVPTLLTLYQVTISDGQVLVDVARRHPRYDAVTVLDPTNAD